MSTTTAPTTTFPTLLDGQPAREPIDALAFAGFAHFTAMQVRGGRVRGLDLHLERLVTASRRLFGASPSPERFRDDLRAALHDAPADLSLTLTVFDADGEFTNEPGERTLRTLIRTASPATGPAGPLALDIVGHERFLPEIKHVGEGAKTYYMRRARAAGFDDAAFMDRQGRLSEASIWNLAFWDGEQVVWPEAEILTGTTMGIVRRRLDGIPQRTEPVRPADLGRFRGAVVMNSWTPGIAVPRIGDVEFDASEELVRVAHAAFEREPWVVP
ncbi:aminotransferase class IV family protein [Nocardia puris]|uniref:Branched-subunit amino acid aminotransferase/4-amino-4-deoxychorismate lyase n=1 Tax=Nocardia puris TaxID=208602 RepID=A0A366E3X4_9NOCA|nr:aminotransferase class IV family protein [Nocardia puris]MBF6209524.1 aminotransferase class IV family protein [Nocardia puris]MBF6366096.1 aminotransferase class IV family protein [Nocardia puris]MBF6458563.1 aminotransferase class IV family protein [Nocardia puris]RBO96214.1 branched-subunit amino acid aminotransferase/4-amino-4-deoxychorismate lyase [Nocardia puris]